MDIFLLGFIVGASMFSIMMFVVCKSKDKTAQLLEQKLKEAQKFMSRNGSTAERSGGN